MVKWYFSPQLIYYVVCKFPSLNPYHTSFKENGNSWVFFKSHRKKLSLQLLLHWKIFSINEENACWFKFSWSHTKRNPYYCGISLYNDKNILIFVQNPKWEKLIIVGKALLSLQAQSPHLEIIDLDQESFRFSHDW